jgi:hypothetical protein
VYQNSCSYGTICTEVPELTLRHIGAGVAPRNTVGVLCVPTYVTVESLSVCVCVRVINRLNICQNVRAAAYK